MIEKITEQKWMIACFLLIVPTLLRCFNLLTEGGLITVWLLVAGGYFAADVTQAALAKKDDPA